MTTIHWEFHSHEIETLQAVIEEYQETTFVSKRISNNVEGSPPDISEGQVWDAHLTALLTSQQRSGPDSPVSQFIQNELGALSLEKCRETSDISQLVSSKLEDHGGVRFYNNIGESCEKNYQLLFDEGEWSALEAELETLQELRCQDPHPSAAEQEREVCQFLYEGIGEGGLHRIGPKQSRNILQVLGLTRYETPLDSRISRWLNENLELPYHISGDGLSNPEFYNFHMDLIQSACEEANEIPCVFDAAVFSSYDSEWSEEAADAIF